MPANDPVHLVALQTPPDGQEQKYCKMEAESQSPYTKEDFRDELLLVKSDIEESDNFSDDEYWFIRLLDRCLISLRYGDGGLSGAMPSCGKPLEIGFSRLHSLHQDPNKAPFPLPGDLSPEDLRPWFPSVNEDDVICLSPVEEEGPRWTSTNPMSRYYFPTLDWAAEVTAGMPSPCSADTNNTEYFKSILRPWCHGGSAFTCLHIGTEAAWQCLQPGLVSREVLTPEQEETWRRRQTSRDLYSSTRMATRRQQLALYFAKTYHYKMEDLEVYLGFASRMEQNAKDLENLCGIDETEP